LERAEPSDLFANWFTNMERSTFALIGIVKWTLLPNTSHHYTIELSLAILTNPSNSFV
jgi:hypothetical protein